MTKSVNDEQIEDQGEAQDGAAQQDEVIDVHARDLNATANPEVGNPTESQKRFTDHQAPAGEGITSPYMGDGNDLAETSVFDGKGNEAVVVVGQDDQGRRSEGTGPDRASAIKDMKAGEGRLGRDFSPGE